MSSKRKNQPTPIYVFVVISLAAFLTLFTLWRRPRAKYLAQITVPSTVRVVDEASTEWDHLNTLRTELLSPTTVLQGLQNAGMIQGNAIPEMRHVAREIVSRMGVGTVTVNNQTLFKLALVTEHPSVGAALLDQMIFDRQEIDSPATSLNASPAIATRVRGTSISASGLALLILSSALVGVGGLMLLEQSKEQAVMLTEEEVVSTANLPVIGDFTRGLEIPARTRQVAWRRRFGAAVRVAEVAIAATVVLMFYNLATQQAFSDLLVNDPLSAYSEAVGRILG